MTSSKVIWQVYLGRRFETELWADYKLADNLLIDADYMTKRYELRQLMLEQYGATWTINFSLMTQVNGASGTSKKIRRTVVATERVTMDEFVALAS